jgi:threonine 3-dehydrogenase
MGTMRAVVKKGPGPGASLENVEVPRCKPSEILVKVLASSICGTDLHIFNWTDWAQTQVKPPRIFGHEFCGEVVEAGRAVGSFIAGDRVSVESHIPCGACRQCRDDQRHICDNLEIIGLHRDGCFAEFAAVPEVCAWKNPPGTPPEIGSVMEPMGNAVHAVHEARVAARRVAVFGAGPTGLFTVAVARAMKAARVFAVEVNPRRLKLAGEMGADELFDGRDEDLVPRLHRAGGGNGVDIAFEMTGNAQAYAGALRSLRKGGTLVAFGIPPKPLELDLADEVILTGRRIIGIVGRHMFKTWDMMQRLLDEKKIDPVSVITHRFRLAEFEEAFKTLASPDTDCGKVVLLP